MDMPPQMMGKPPAGSSPAAIQSGNPGENAQAVAKIREAIQLMSAALPELPLGNELHTWVAKVISEGSKKFPESEAAPGVQDTALRDLAKQVQQQKMMQALMRQQQAAGQAGGQTQPQPEMQP